MPKGCVSKACVCASVTVWVLVSIIVLTITVIIYLRPIMQVVRYAKTSCRIDKDFYSVQYKCKCGTGCDSFYPCYMVHVSFYKSDTEFSPVPLYADDTQQRQVLAASGNLKESCSIKVCNKDIQTNREEVLHFKQYISQSRPYIDCFYDPWAPKNGAIMQIMWPGFEVFHAVFWPFISVLSGLVTCIMFCRWCRKKEGLIVEANKKDPPVELRQALGAGNEAQEVVEMEEHCSLSSPNKVRRKPLLSL